MLDYLKRATADLRDTRRRLREAEDRGREPIAVVGMGCRYPGGVGSPDDLWDLVAAGRDAITDVPGDRGWDVDPRTAASGGFLTGAGEFDPGFFGISPREALAMDPQQRLLLETSWEALERAGVDPVSLRGTRAGVFVGAAVSGYGGSAGEDLAGHLLTGNVASVMSGRLAYFLGVEGPAVTLDTACSSSLVALHLAAQALRGGECSLALAAGATVMVTPGLFGELGRQGGLAADGRCKAFAESADGAGFAEGVGVLVLETLSEARRNGHRVLAVVRGSAVNQDGASNGLTAPNGPSQRRVIQAALDNARLAPSDVDVVEAHGTGTTLGDPIEAQALLATYGRDRETPLWLGSVKSNIGHTQAAAGVAGVIKVVQALRHETLPRTLHVDEPTSHVDWTAGSVSLLTEARPWPRGQAPRRAGVSSFGISGTNAHVIIEQAPAVDEPEAGPDVPVAPWVLSGATPAALREQAARLLDVEGRAEDIGFSLATTRAALEHRAVVLDRAGLDALAADLPAPSLVAGVAGSSGKPVFVFPGQGAQWVGMGRGLIDTHPVFAARMAECAAALGAFVDWDLTSVLGDAEALERVDVVQPALWAVMVSLAAVWESSGVTPAAVVGHSQGEIAAAVVAGALSLEDGARVVALRSRAIAARLAGRGGMVSLALPVEQVRERIAAFNGVGIAAVNGAASVVISGDNPGLDAVMAAAEADGVRVRRVPVDYASHSAQVEALEAELLDVLGPIQPRDARVPLRSTVTGEVLDGVELDAGYWYRNLRQTVLFHDVVTALDGAVFIEVSPHPVVVSGMAGTAVGTLRRDQDGLDRLALSAGQAWALGVDLDWSAWFPGGRVVDLPTYAFQRQHFWLADSGSAPAAWGDRGDLYAVGWQPHKPTPADGTWALAARPDGLTEPWASLPLAADLADTPDVLVWPAGFGATPDTAVATTTDGLAFLQTWLDTGSGTLVALTRDALGVRDGDRVDGLGAAGLAGLLASAQSENPGRIVHVDTDGSDLTLVGPGDEPRLAVRDGEILVPRLAPAPAGEAPGWDPEGTVLITGALGMAGSVIAKHVPAAKLVLLGRRGMDTPGAAELVAELAAAGTAATVLACDVADRDALKAVLDGIDDLTAVVHAAGAVDDGTIGALTPERVAGVMAAKAAAWNLHELTGDLTAFVVFSSAAATLGAAGQGNYAAGNTFVESLVAHRRALGLPGQALGWGLWADDSGMTAGLTRADRARIARGGFRGLTATAATRLWDEALASGHPVVLPVGLDVAALRGQAVAPVLRGLAGEPEPETGPALAGRLAGLPDAEAAAVVTELVRAQAAAVLGHTDPAAVGAAKPFRDLGFDSLTAVELRNRLTAATGVALPATVVFDYPTCTALAAHLRAEATGTDAAFAAATAATGTGEPIAIVGMACRFPGGADSPEAYWDLLAEGRDAMGGFPADRGWPTGDYAAVGGFLDGAASFDAGFFEISPREALAMDPQQRLLLELSWEAVERAGIAPSSLRGSDTGVYTGTSGLDYVAGLREAPEGTEGYLLTGNAASVVSGRVSYALGLEGPSMTVDTACSSSLVAVHLAAQALRSGETSLALAGGVRVMASPMAFTEFARQRGLAADGRCKAFAEGADGTGWGEGAGLVVLERLSDARRNGHTVLALLSGSAVNQDGASNGLTAPNGPSQQRV
ncbi:beta-ketoacyl synthase N-terminal-like domain-containing protein, partial [Actinokineospora pegani]